MQPRGTVSRGRRVRRCQGCTLEHFFNVYALIVQLAPAQLIFTPYPHTFSKPPPPLPLAPFPHLFIYSIHSTLCNYKICCVKSATADHHIEQVQGIYSIYTVYISLYGSFSLFLFCWFLSTLCFVYCAAAALHVNCLALLLLLLLLIVICCAESFSPNSFLC